MARIPMFPEDFSDEVKQQNKLVELPTDFFNGVFTEPYKYIRIAYRNSNDPDDVVFLGIPSNANTPDFETFQAVQIHDIDIIKNFREPEFLSELGAYTLFRENITEAFLAYDVRTKDTPQRDDSNMKSGPYYWDFIVRRKDPEDVRWDDIVFVDIDIDGTGLMKLENPRIDIPNYPAGNLQFTRDLESSRVEASTGGNAIFKILAAMVRTELNIDGSAYQGGTDSDRNRRDSVVATSDDDVYIPPQDFMPSFADNVSIDDVLANVGGNVNLTLPEAMSGNLPLTYSLSPELPDGLSFDPFTRVLFGVPKEITSKREYKYTVSDEDMDTATLTFSITVGEKLNLLPTFSGVSIPNISEGVNIPINVTLPQASGGDGVLSYSITPALPSGLLFDSGTRVLSGMASALMASQTYTYVARDEDGDTAEIDFNIEIVDLIPSFAPGAAIADISTNRGIAVNVTLPKAIGGDSPLVYSLSPALPNGLVFAKATRVLSGKATVLKASDEYTYVVSDRDGDTAELTFDLEVLNLVPTFGETVIPNRQFTVGTAVNITLPEVTGGDLPIVYSITGTLPDGITFDADTRVLSGNPTAAKTVTAYTYTATDNYGEAVTLSFNLTVVPMPEVDTEPRLNNNINNSRLRRLEPIDVRRNDELNIGPFPAATRGNAPLVYDLVTSAGVSLFAQRGATSATATVRFNQDTRMIVGRFSQFGLPETEFFYKVTDADGDTDQCTQKVRIRVR